MNSLRRSTVLVALGIGWSILSCQSAQQTTNPAPTPPAPVSPVATEPASTNTFSGIVAHVNATARLLTVKASSGQKDFVVGRKTKVFTETSTHGALSTLNTGDRVNVEYELQDGVATATRIVRTAVAAGNKPAPAVERLEKMLNPDPSNPYNTE